MKTTGANLLAHVLQEAGIKVVSGIPGHTIFPFAVAVGDQEGLSPFLVRHEAIAAFAADVYFRVSGDLMAVFTHTLPGTSNLAVGVANAYADSSAMLVIAGETARDAGGRGAYQELARGMDSDVPGFLRHVTKKSWITHNPLQLVEQAYRAIKIARLGRPGPVALHVYQDVWEQEVEIPDWPTSEGYLIGNAFRPDAADVQRAADLLARAKRPLIVAGNGVNLGRAQDALLHLAEGLNAPVATTVTGKGAFPENHPLSVGVIGWVGTAAANWAGREADVVLAVGARLSETATSSWQPGITFDFGRTRLIQCDVDPTEIANVFAVDVALIGDASRALNDLVEALPVSRRRPEWEVGIHQAKVQWAEVVAQSAAASGRPLPVGPVVRALREATVGRPVNIVCDVGKHHKWVAQQFETHPGDAVISSMGAGTMGIGPCGAIGAALGRPDARTIAWTGDGGLSMTPFVLPTAAEHQLPILFVTIDDGSFGEIVNIQEQKFGRTVFAQFDGSGKNPGYRLAVDRLSEACGVPARRIETVDQLSEALRWADGQSGPALLDVVVDRKSRVPSGGGTKLGDIWNHPIYPWVKRPVSIPAGNTEGENL
ncbi:MAG TPA: thiamine pyrophosphate-binding protein [Candidatus Micrarchaeaceae archaeon]|nr:thiamine pyrophosphate-binding protein [Candidatus Micrarchaeaceae archaeon]